MRKGKQLSVFLAFLMFLVLWALYGWNFWNGDRDGYELYYNTRDTLASWGGEVGYGYLNIVAREGGLSFQSFQILISLVTLLLIFRYVVKRTISPFVSIVMYAVCFFSLDFVLMRNFLAFAIFLQGMLILFEDKPYSRIKYGILIMLAATIHQSSLMYILFIVMPVSRVVPLGKFFLLFLSFIFAYILIRFSVPLPDAIALHFNYYNTSLKSSFANVCVHLASLVLMTFAVLAERKNLREIKCISSREKELAFVLNLNLFSLFFLVLYFESEIFVRLLRSVMFFNILHCVNSLFLLRRTYLFLTLYILIFSVYLVLFFVVPVASFSIIPLFNSNLLLN
jgi:hypothetical protein